MSRKWHPDLLTNPCGLVPDMVMDLENFVMEFFNGLPRVTILSISCFRDGYGGLPREILPYSATTHAWLMISRFNLKGVPMVVILPISSVFQGIYLSLHS